MLFRNAILFGLGQGIPALIAFGGLSLYTRLLDPAAYGEFTVVFTAATMLSLGVFGWMRVGILRFTSGLGRRRQLIFATSMMCFAAVAGVVMTIGFGADVAGVGAIYGFPATVLALCIVALGGSYLSLTFVQTSMRAGVHLWLSVVRAIIQFAVAVALLIYADWQGLALIVGVIVAHGLCAVLALHSHRKELFSGRWSTVSARRLWRFGWPTCVKTGTAFLETYLDRVLLIALVDASAAGIYGVSYDLMSRGLYLLISAISMSGIPIVVRAVESHGLRKAGDTFTRYGTLLLGASMPGVVGLWLLNDNFCVVLIGEEFRDGVMRILPLVALSTLLIGVRDFYSDFAFEAARQPIKQLPVTFLAAAVSIVLNLILIPRYGILGAAIASVAARTSALALSIYLARKLFPLPIPLANTGRIVLACGAMGLALWPTLGYVGWEALIGQIALGAGSYVLAVFILDINGLRHRFQPQILTRLKTIMTRTPAK